MFNLSCQVAAGLSKYPANTARYGTRFNLVTEHGQIQFVMVVSGYPMLYWAIFRGGNMQHAGETPSARIIVWLPILAVIAWVATFATIGLGTAIKEHQGRVTVTHDWIRSVADSPNPGLDRDWREDKK